MQRYIDKVSDVNVDGLRMNDLVISGTGAATNKLPRGRAKKDEKQETLRVGYITPIGSIAKPVWEVLAEKVIDNEPAGADGILPSKAFEALNTYLAEHGNKYFRTHEAERAHEARRLCVCRVYTDPSWDGYEAVQTILKAG